MFDFIPKCERSFSCWWHRNSTHHLSPPSPSLPRPNFVIVLILFVQQISNYLAMEGWIPTSCLSWGGETRDSVHVIQVLLIFHLVDVSIPLFLSLSLSSSPLPSRPLITLLSLSLSWYLCWIRVGSQSQVSLYVKDHFCRLLFDYFGKLLPSLFELQMDCILLVKRRKKEEKREKQRRREQEERRGEEKDSKRKKKMKRAEGRRVRWYKKSPTTGNAASASWALSLFNEPKLIIIK